MLSERPSRRELLASANAVGTLTLAGCSTGDPASEREPAIRASPRSEVGHPPDVRLTGFEPERPITLQITASDARARNFEGSWSLRTDSQGEAALSGVEMWKTLPESTWYGADRGSALAKWPPEAMLLHHLRPTDGSVSPPVPVLEGQNTVELTVRARPVGRERTLAQATHSRVYLDREVAQERIESEERVGWLYSPSTEEPHPGVMILHGVSAAIPHRLGRLLATQGYATFILQYFDAPGLPGSLKRIPLEHFDNATHWLWDRPDVRDEWVGLIGISRGVEAALLTAAALDAPTSVVGYHGGGVIERGVEGVPPRAWASAPAWTREGSPIVEPASSEAVFDVIREVYQRRCDIDAPVNTIRSRAAEDTLSDVLVPVEEIRGPVLLIAGADDRQWPTVPVSALTVDRLEHHNQPHPYGLQAYCDAGHVFAVPYADYTGAATSTEYGGSPTANARAAADSWPVVLDYLDASSRSEQGE